MWHSGLVADLPCGWSRFDPQPSCFFLLICFYSFCWPWPITASFSFFCNKRNIGSFFHCACIAYRDMKHLESSTSTQRNYQNDRIFTRKPRKFAGSCVSLLRVAQFVLKIAHLAISTEPCGPLACGLLSRLWLLIVPLIHTTSHSTILFLLEFWMS